MEIYNSRKDVPEKYKWNLNDFCQNEQDFNKKYNQIVKEIPTLKKYKNCTKNSALLFEFIEKSMDLSCRLEDITVYAFLINDAELGNPKSIERLNKCLNLSNDLEKTEAFFVPEILGLSQDEYNTLFQNNSELFKYKAYLDLIFRDKDHSLNENEEVIVSELINSMNHFDDMSSTLINSEHNYGKVTIDGHKEIIAVNNYRKLLKNKDEKLRKKVYTLFNKKLSEYSISNASFLNSYVAMNVALSRIYKFSSSWEQKLFSLNMPNEAFEVLRKTTEDNVSSFQKYLELKRNVLKLDILHPYDMHLEMSHTNKKYTIEESQKILLEALKPLGEDYIKHFMKIFDNKYIDYCQYKGKTSGAYSCSTALNDSRILMSFNGDLDSVSTIAHEGGHNVHHQYVKENNEPIYRNVTTLVAEVASLTNEFLLSHYIVENAKTKDEKLHGLDNILSVMTSNLFGAVREGKMEQDMYNKVHNGETLTKEYLDDLSFKSLKKYYGDKVKLDKLSKNGWVTRSHYYMHFYLYNYAICVSIAANIADKIINNDEKMLNNYLKFLKTGSDVWPEDAFRILGIDITDEKVYEYAINYFDKLVSEFDNIYKEKEV